MAIEYNYYIIIFWLIIYFAIEQIVAKALVMLNYYLTEPDMILFNVGLWIESKFGSILSKPMGLCATCMVSLYWIVPINVILIFGAVGHFYIPFLMWLKFFGLSLISGLSLSYWTTYYAKKIRH